MMWKPDPNNINEFMSATRVITAGLWQRMGDNDDIHQVLVECDGAADAKVRQLIGALDLDDREGIVERISQWLLVRLTSKSILAMVDADLTAGRDIQSVWPDYEMTAQ